MGKFGLELHPDKTRRIEFGRRAERDRKRRGEGKPETFDFLGFTHISGKDRNGNFAVKRHTIGKRLRGKLGGHGPFACDQVDSQKMFGFQWYLAKWTTPNQPRSIFSKPH